jgi:type I restriction enzyme S subunit
MSKQEKKGLVPILRFVKDTGADFPSWKCVELNSIAKRIVNKNKGEKVNRVLTNSAADGIVDQRDYFDKDIAVKGNLESYYIVDTGDYVYNPRVSIAAPVGPISKNKIGKGVMSPLYTVFRFNNPNNDFYEQFFKSSKWHSYLQTVSNSGARHDRMSITNDEFMRMPVPEVDENEQQKIADCLSSIDDLITAQGQQLDTLKKHKNSLMQQLFPVEGETVPRMRFAEFINSKSWEAKFLKELGSFIGGGTPSKSNSSYWKGNIPWISSSDIPEDSIHQVNVRRFITKEALENSAAKIIPQNSILLVSRVGVGKLAISEFAVCTSQDFTNFTPHQNNLIFLAYSLKSQTKTLLGYNQGMAIKGFTKEDVSNLKLFIPSLEEQQKIADCLSSIDELISAQAQILETLKDHKKGLMQQLFPSIDEVAG